MRNDWNAVYVGQDAILEACKDIKPLIFGGGTAIHRCVLSEQKRESEDVDFFIDHPCRNDELNLYAIEIRKALEKTGKLKIINYNFKTEEKSHRFLCQHNDSDEIIKIDLLNFTGGRFKDTSFIHSKLFSHIENKYNLILYKLKALSDRQDTVKDLYDLYFLFRELDFPVNIKEMFIDLEMKFEATTGYKYSPDRIVEALKAKHRQWDIISKNTFGLHDDIVANAIYDFRDDFVEALINPSTTELNLSYDQYIANRINSVDFNITEDEYIDIVEPNMFIALSLKQHIAKRLFGSEKSIPSNNDCLKKYNCKL